jgi:hypothetical protein
MTPAPIRSKVPLSDAQDARPKEDAHEQDARPKEDTHDQDSKTSAAPLLPGADYHAASAAQLLGSVPCACPTADQHLAAAQVHATLAVAARLAELADAIRSGGDAAGMP